ncbi:MAG: Signal recognition particle protein Ffh, partial [uncultured Nocardioides sp.]
VRDTLRPACRHLQEPPRQGAALRGRHRRDRARDPHRAARGRRGPARRQGVRRRGQGEGTRRGGQRGAQPGAADRQDRQRRARHHPGRGDPAAAVRQDGAHRHHAGRPAGCRQDDARGQARPLAEGAGQGPGARRGRPAASQRGPAAPGQRRAGRRARVRARARQRHRRPGGRREGLGGRGHPQAPRRRHHRHRRPARCRRRADAAGLRHPRRRRPRRGAVRRRRHDRPGRRQHRARLPPGSRLRRRGAHQARRRRARWCCALDRLDHRQAGHVRLQRREDGRLRPVPPRPDGLAHPRHGRHAHPDRAGREDLRRGAGQQGGREAARRSGLHPRRLPPADAADAQAGLDVEDHGDAARDGAVPRAARQLRRARDRPHPGDDPVDDAGRARQPQDDRRLAAGPHRQGLRRAGLRRQPDGHPLLRCPQDDAADGARWRHARDARAARDGRHGGWRQEAEVEEAGQGPSRLRQPGQGGRAGEGGCREAGRRSGEPVRQPRRGRHRLRAGGRGARPAQGLLQVPEV